MSTIIVRRYVLSLTNDFHQIILYLLCLFRLSLEVLCISRASMSTGHQFNITEDDIKRMPKLNFTGKCGIINTPMDEERYRNEINEIQSSSEFAFNISGCGL